MNRHLIGIGGGAVALLAGLWLVLAPFALGYQPSGAEWSDGTRVGVWTGLAVIVAATVAVAAFATALLRGLRTAGVIESAAASRSGTDAADDGTDGGSPALESVLEHLATALLADLDEQRAGSPASRPTGGGRGIGPGEHAPTRARTADDGSSAVDARVHAEA